MYETSIHTKMEINPEEILMKQWGIYVWNIGQIPHIAGDRIKYPIQIPIIST